MTFWVEAEFRLSLKNCVLLFMYIFVLQSMGHEAISYQPGSTVLTYQEELSISQDQTSTLQGLLCHPGDSEGSSNSEGSHATSDSGRYSHDEIDMTDLSSGASSHLPSLTAMESRGSDCTVDVEGHNQVMEERQDHRKLWEPMEDGFCQREAHNSSQSALSLQCVSLSVWDVCERCECEGSGILFFYFRTQLRSIH